MLCQFETWVGFNYPILMLIKRKLLKKELQCTGFWYYVYCKPFSIDFALCLEAYWHNTSGVSSECLSNTHRLQKRLQTFTLCAFSVLISLREKGNRMVAVWRGINTGSKEMLVFDKKRAKKMSLVTIHSQCLFEKRYIFTLKHLHNNSCQL